jgi:hypothetical protein
MREVYFPIQPCRYGLSDELTFTAGGQCERVTHCGICWVIARVFFFRLVDAVSWEATELLGTGDTARDLVQIVGALLTKVLWQVLPVFRRSSSNSGWCDLGRMSVSGPSGLL